MSKVLVVDDDTDILDSVRIVLEHFKFEVVCLSDCRKILQTTADNQPYLILLDINLGFCDGRKLCLEMKDTHAYPHHILLFSANPEMVQSINLYRADDFIGKPFEIKKFVMKIREHMPVL